MRPRHLGTADACYGVAALALLVAVSTSSPLVTTHLSVFAVFIVAAELAAVGAVKAACSR